MIFSDKDKLQIAKHGMTPDEVVNQLGMIERGFPPLEVIAPATIGEGILQIDNDLQKYADIWQNTLQKQSEKTTLKVEKFVPASGAASRMFKDLYAFVDADYDQPTTTNEKLFFDKIDLFAFYDLLNDKCREQTSQTIDQLKASGRYKDIVRTLLDADGLGYGHLPKGLLLFHRTGNKAFTPIEEHMKEACAYAAVNGKARLHFTVSHEHHEQFELFAREKAKELGSQRGVEIEVSLSEQHPSTDTIAADNDGQPFRNADGTLLFRPGGHGALIKNLNELDSDIVFIKNIDNITPEYMLSYQALYKQALAGLLVDMKNEIHRHLKAVKSLNEHNSSLHETVCDAAMTFMRETLQFRVETDMTTEEKRQYCLDMLNRPIRVCGVVKNTGEPGGGPFIVRENAHCQTNQILEMSQLNSAKTDKGIDFSKSTHFNPVDIVCYLRDDEGKRYNLIDCVDKHTGFISEKSKDGKPLKALELPGLWNGAMSHWLTIFVELPIETFNPVKQITDLLRPEHQDKGMA